MKTKKWIALVLSALLLCGVAATAIAGTPAEDAHLSFREDGSFTILNFSDIQDDAVLSPLAKAFFRRAVKTVKPDLIVLTGDNIAGYSAKTKTLAFAAIRQYMDIFEQLRVPVAMVYGNHDDDDTKATKEDEMKIYAQYKVNLAYDEGDALYGCGTYNVPIYASANEDLVKFNLYMIDSGSYDLERGGYDYVHEDQIQWYKDTSARLAAENGGLVPSIAFQHIVVPEIYDALEKTDEVTNASRGGQYYTLPATAAEGSILGESPCPGTYNAGEFTAFKEGGDVLAVVCGHDHVNSFVIPYEGIDLINTPTCGFSSYGNSETRGARVIRLNENDPTSYETETILFTELMKDYAPAMFMAKLRDFFEKVGDFFENIGDSIKNLFQK